MRTKWLIQLFNDYQIVNLIIYENVSFHYLSLDQWYSMVYGLWSMFYGRINTFILLIKNVILFN